MLIIQRHDVIKDVMLYKIIKQYLNLLIKKTDDDYAELIYISLLFWGN